MSNGSPSGGSVQLLNSHPIARKVGNIEENEAGSPKGPSGSETNTRANKFGYFPCKLGLKENFNILTGAANRIDKYLLDVNEVADGLGVVLFL